MELGLIPETMILQAIIHLKQQLEGLTYFFEQHLMQVSYVSLHLSIKKGKKQQTPVVKSKQTAHK